MAAQRFSNCRILIAAVAIATMAAVAPVDAARPSRDHVLVLHSYHKGQWTDRLLEGIGSVLGPLAAVDLNIEYMDTKKLATPAYLNRLAALYALKYQALDFAVVIVSDDNAYRFALKHQETLFDNAPIVFCGVNRFDPAEVESGRPVTGVVEKGGVAETLQIATAVRPDAKAIHVIVDHSHTGQINKAAFLTVLHREHPHLKPVFLEGVALDALSTALAAIPPGDLAFFISFWKDQKGHPVTPAQLSEAFSRCGVPIFGRSEWMMGRGLTGGKCVSGFRQGEAAARLARRILDGADPGTLPVITDSPNQFMFDTLLMERHRIAPAMLPPDSVIINGRPPSFFRQYRDEILAVLLAAVLLVALVAVLGVNIIVRRRVEAALRVSERRFRTLVENAADTLFVSDDTGRLVDVNPQACRMLGYQRDELLRLSVTDIDTSFSDWERAETAWRELKPQTPVVLESQYRRKDGTLFPVYLRVSAFEDQGRRYYIGLAQDATERKLIEQSLVESEEKYRQLVQHAPSGIFEFSFETMTFVSVNDVMCRYTGFSQRELMQMSPLDLLAEESRALMAQRLETILGGDVQQETHEYRIKSREGEDIWVVMNARFSYEDGRPKLATVVVHDVTALKQAEAEKAELEIQLQQAQKMEAIGTLAGGIAHDFNNLLMGIQGNVSLLLLDVPPEDSAAAQLKTIERHVTRGVDLTRQLLGFARGGKYEIKPTDLNVLMDSSAMMFGQTRREIAIHQQHQADLWSVEADQGQIEQVLLNLFVNAWQAMPDGGDLFLESANETLDVVAANRLGLQPGHYVRMEVSDTGIGMDTDTLQRAFDPFFTTKAVGSGTGLGLASAYGIVKNHGGMITAKSRPGEGTRIVIYLPASDRAATAETQMPDALLYGSERILLVDDDKTVLDVGRELLKRLGYAVQLADSGQAAVSLLEAQAGGIDLVILDMIMTGMGGSETYDRLKTVDPDVKVLLSSGYSLDGQAAGILQRGCDGFIQKPFDIQALSRKLREIIEG
jgi:two-component system cell cycle sensor histidine kinase/response regulator CckA